MGLALLQDSESERRESNELFKVVRFGIILILILKILGGFAIVMRFELRDGSMGTVTLSQLFFKLLAEEIEFPTGAESVQFFQNCRWPAR